MLTCSGPPAITSMIPLQFFYLTSLSVYAFFLFFAFFVYKRSRNRLSGKMASIALLCLAIYVGSAVLIYDMMTPQSHIVAWGIGWVAACLSVPLWVHMILLVEKERSEDTGSSLGRRVAVSAMYIGGSALALVGTVAPAPASNWLFDMDNFGVAPWPFCQWTHFWTQPGPYYPSFALFILSCLIYSTTRLGLLVRRANQSIRKASTVSGARQQLEVRNEYIWLLAATSMLAWSGIFAIAMVAIGVQMPESIGHVMLAVGGLIVGLIISRHNALVADRNVAPDFYRASASTAIITAAVIFALYLGEGGNVSKATLLAMVTAAILFFVNIDSWWKLMDNLFLGPQVAQQRARVRHVLEDTAPDEELVRIKAIYGQWSDETKRIFILLGKGMSRQSIASTARKHLSTVDQQIRRIKDDLRTDRLEDVRSFAHKMLIYLRITEESKESARL